MSEPKFQIGQRVKVKSHFVLYEQKGEVLTTGDSKIRVQLDCATPGVDSLYVESELEAI